MDRRSWPWKKKSSDKAAAEKAVATIESASASFAVAGDQDNYKKSNYVQISMEAYSHLTGLEDQVKAYEIQVKTLEDQNKELEEKLSAAHSDMTTKESLVKQHAKVAEEAVSGWEKAEAEALALKTHLESVTLSKLTAEDRALHLDGALKECMRQIRNLKDEHEQELNEVVLTKTKQWEKAKGDLEAKMGNLEQELLHSAAESAALSRSLQERSNTLLKLREEKSQADAEIEILKSNLESCKREINSLKYEHHVASKELEIRNEEKNMSMKSAEVANKQHLEGVKKIAKLEAECQRLRGLVRKKLPGPAALAQMKLEVENLGRDYEDTCVKRSPVKPHSPHLSSLASFSVDNVQKFHKENEFLTERLLAMEEETKMLKEALAKRNSELQASRNICAKTASRLQSLEAQLQINNQQRSSPRSNVQNPTEVSSSQHASNPPSLTSMSEDGNDEVASCAESWGMALISEFSQSKKEKNIENSNKVDNVNHLELMDDFLEMEKLACLSNDTNGDISAPDSSNNNRSEILKHNSSVRMSSEKDLLHSEPPHDLDPLANQVSSSVELPAHTSDSDANSLSLERLQSKIAIVFESKDTEMGKILEDVKRIVQDMQDTLHQHSVSCVFKEIHCPDATCDRQVCPEDDGHTAYKIPLPRDNEEGPEAEKLISEELATAISQIQDFLLFLGKEATVFRSKSPDGGLNQKVEEFSATTNKVLCRKMSLADFVHELSHVLTKASELDFNDVGYKGAEVETNNFDCVDKVALPEDKLIQKDSMGEKYANGCEHTSDSSSNPEVPHDSNVVIGIEPNAVLCKCSFEEFEQIKLEKDNLALDLARCTADLERTKSRLQEMEQALQDFKSQLASSEKMNSLAETQLKCMAESYKSLEMRAQELETEVNLLRVKTDNLENELQEEKNCHQNALARCQDLQEQLKRNENCSQADIDHKAKQDRELAAAAEKLAECQETIFLLGRQLNSLRPQTELIGSPFSERSQRGEGNSEHGRTNRSLNLQDIDQAELMDSAASTDTQRMGSESPIDLYSAPLGVPENDSNHPSRSPISSNHPKHRPTKSGSSSSSSAPTPEKHSRGFSRFFSSKGRIVH